MRRTKEDAEETRRALLSAALRVFGRDGYVTARLDDIAREAGVTRGAIAHHFGGKAEMWVELGARREAIIADTAREAALRGGTPTERLRNLMIALVARLEEDEEYRAVWSLMVFDRANAPPEGLAATVERHKGDAHQRGIGRLFEMGVAAGEFRADLDPATAARVFFGLAAGVALNWLSAPQVFSIKDEAPRLIDIFLNGISAKA